MRTVPRQLRSTLSLGLVLGVLCALGSTGCSSPPEGTVIQADTVDGIPIYYVTKERHGQSVQIANGQTLAVVLPNKVGSSRRWTPEGLDPAVLARSSGTQTIGPRTKGGMIGGAAGLEKVHFKAVGPGTTTLRMTLQKRPQDGGGRVVFEVRVVVTGPASSR
jgi:hypothetical protein